jgi:hypothetical protein
MTEHHGPWQMWLLCILILVKHIRMPKTTLNFTFTGDGTKTWNDISGGTPTTLTLDDLSEMNEQNQVIFANQPFSWWFECLKNSTITYTPENVSARWSYKTFSISNKISNMILPSKIKTTMLDSEKRIKTVIYEKKIIDMVAVVQLG